VAIYSHIRQIMADAPVVDRQCQFPAAHGAINRYVESPLSSGGLIAGLPPDPALRKSDVEGVRLGVSPSGPSPKLLPSQCGGLSFDFRF
jgi:hypothetical protein